MQEGNKAESNVGCECPAPPPPEEKKSECECGMCPPTSNDARAKIGGLLAKVRAARALAMGSGPPTFASCPCPICAEEESGGGSSSTSGASIKVLSGPEALKFLESMARGKSPTTATEEPKTKKAKTPTAPEGTNVAGSLATIMGYLLRTGKLDEKGVPEFLEALATRESGSPLVGGGGDTLVSLNAAAVDLAILAHKARLEGLEFDPWFIGTAFCAFKV